MFQAMYKALHRKELVASSFLEIRKFQCTIIVCDTPMSDIPSQTALKCSYSNSNSFRHSMEPLLSQSWIYECNKIDFDLPRIIDFKFKVIQTLYGTTFIFLTDKKAFSYNSNSYRQIDK